MEYELPDPPKEEPEAPPKEEPAPEAEAAKEEAPEEPASTGDPKIDALVLERDRAIQEMRRLNDASRTRRSPGGSTSWRTPPARSSTR